MREGHLPEPSWNTCFRTRGLIRVQACSLITFSCCNLRLGRLKATIRPLETSPPTLGITSACDRLAKGG